MSRKLLYIVNPVSGTGTKAPVHDLIRSKTEAAGFPFAIFPSVASGDYNFLLEEITSQHFTDIVIAGGDGTVNQVVHGLSGLDLQFGILPCGSGNGLAFSAGIPKNLDKAIDIVFRGHGVRSDAFMINDRFACMLCGLGFDAQVAHDFANDPNRGLATYIRQTVKNFFSARTWPFVITTGTREIHSEAFFISI
ncbi:MAG TPA: acylglycerol kinase family protein, partial [Flavisolibacter sp.]